jgi:two-component sensor histidine kinase/PAS domain-containing protein
VLADLAFSDLVLWLPTWNTSGYVAAAQLRPTTGPTVFNDDLVGSFLPRGRRPVVDEALAQRRVITVAGADPASPVRGIPVPSAGRVIAVIAQHTDPSVDPARSPLEVTYVQVAERLAGMVAEGTFPPVGDSATPEDSPRVGDGLILLDPDGVVTYASPNALSAYRRLGLAADLGGNQLAQLSRFLTTRGGPVEADPSAVLRGRTAGGTEIEAKGAVVALRTVPLRVAGLRTGALVLLRDVSDLRRRDRELVTKDATIREIHHRVKNNLQTVAALLRLQARRLDAPDAVAALAEAERRIGSIALVHETLTTSPDPAVPFDQIADRLLAMVAALMRPEGEGGTEVEGGAGQRVTLRRAGSFGELDADLATPLALVLNELAQNAVEHGLGERGGSVVVRPVRGAGELAVAVEDDGAGLPADFDGAGSAGLGLQIARTLLADLGGSVELGPREGGGTTAVVRLPLLGGPLTPCARGPGRCGA